MALSMAVASAAVPSKSKTVFNRSATRIPWISASSLSSSSKAHLLLYPHHHHHNALHLPSLSWSSKEQLQIPYRARVRASASSSTENRQVQEEQAVFHGQCYVLGDNIDTDQIIPAEHLTLVPSKPGEYEKLGSLAFIGLPSHHPRFVEENQTKSRYSIVIAGSNFGCGSSREHAPVALGASGVKAVVADSYARIFFRNSVATGEIYPLESEGGSSRLCEECSTGDFVTVELASNKLINHTTGKEYGLKPIGDAGPVIGAGGIFAYARKTGMIASAST